LLFKGEETKGEKAAQAYPVRRDPPSSVNVAGEGDGFRLNSLSSWLVSSLLAWLLCAGILSLFNYLGPRWWRRGARLGNEHGELSAFRFGGEDATIATPSAHYLAAPLLALLLFAH